jgi:glycosyltransferase involved in cell wall biosynthesis
MAALARELGRRHTVTVLTSGALGLPAESREGGVRIIRVPVFFRRELAVANFPSMAAYLPMAGWRGLTLRRSGDFDVVNTHFAVPTGPVGQLLGKLYGVPNVLSVLGGDLYDPSKRSSPHRHAWLRMPIRQLLKGADALVGGSRNTLEHVEKIYRVRRASHLIPLGIDRPPTMASGGTRRDLGIADDAFVMVTVGRLVARKATIQLVEALQAARRSGAHLLIVGDGPDAAAVRRAVVQAGLTGRVHLLGQLSDEQKYHALAAADAFVSASQHEGFGLVFLEAMAYGLPIICYDHGGQTDFLVNGETGFVVALNDSQAFAQAIIVLHDQAHLRQAMAQKNRGLVEEFFIDKCANRYETVFEEVMRNFGATSRR